MGQTNNILSDKSVRAMEQEEYKKGIWPELPEKNMAAAVLTSGGNSGTEAMSRCRDWAASCVRIDTSYMSNDTNVTPLRKVLKPDSLGFFLFYGV